MRWKINKIKSKLANKQSYVMYTFMYYIYCIIIIIQRKQTKYTRYEVAHSLLYRVYNKRRT